MIQGEKINSVKSLYKSKKEYLYENKKEKYNK